LLFPMAKSAVRAMDAVTEFVQQNGGSKIQGFVVAGASKRGWTTWLTGAIDTRVKSIAPMVIDVLNMEVQMQHHHDHYLGVTERIVDGYAETLNDYLEMNVVQRLGTPEGDALLEIVDP